MTYNYNDKKPEFINWSKLSEREQFLLTESKTFCMLPWTHLHAWPTGEVLPCCMAHPPGGLIGNLKENTMQEVWNDEPMRKIRRNMLNEKTSIACDRCYEQEGSGFFTMRHSANKRFGHYIDRVKDTQEDGTVENMVLSYWDIRFSNLCNLRCRSCGHLFSSNWYDDQASLIEDEKGKGWGKVWKSGNSRINYAGRTQTDAWEQLEPHLDHVEHIYFAGGEPLIMEEHYRILNALLAKGKNAVRLIYNTNFTELKYKKQNVLELWNQFTNVCIGASLDDMGPRAEFMRKGTDWAKIERNREDMMRISPNVDFYISPTLSIMNAYSLVDFHRDWVAKGLIAPSALNVNILQDPQWFRIDALPAHYKREIEQRYTDHIEWLRPLDHLKRAITGFESAINFMNANDKSNLLPTTRKKLEQLDSIRGENVFDVIPELKGIL